jgi:hypothetical protein
MYSLLVVPKDPITVVCQRLSAQYRDEVPSILIPLNPDHFAPALLGSGKDPAHAGVLLRMLREDALLSLAVQQGGPHRGYAYQNQR